MGPSWRVFVCGAASRAILLAKQKKSGWSGVFRKYLNIKYLYNFQNRGWSLLKSGWSPHQNNGLFFEKSH